MGIVKFKDGFYGVRKEFNVVGILVKTSTVYSFLDSDGVWDTLGDRIPDRLSCSDAHERMAAHKNGTDKRYDIGEVVGHGQI